MGQVRPDLTVDASDKEGTHIHPTTFAVMPGLVPGISSRRRRPTLDEHVDGRNESGHDVAGGAAKADTNFPNTTPARLGFFGPPAWAAHGNSADYGIAVFRWA